ncbi:MAG TPA: HIT family protein [Verrucomicrobiae bacterium]|nr:HIT family protein [Verrucomicrobiae bacterium]
MILSNAPKDYICPICAGIRDTSSPDTLIKQTDFVYDDEIVTAIINTFFMGTKNSGNVIVIPKEHYENIYALPDDVGHRIFEVSKKLAIAMKEAYQCDGIKVIQNNEPAADQHAFHYHLHLYPRYKNDGFNSLLPEQKRLPDPEERAEYAEKIKAALGNTA